MTKTTRAGYAADPDVKRYLQQIGEISIPARAEVVQLANRLADTRSRFKKTMLKIEVVLRDCLGLLTDVQCKRARFDWVFDTCNREREKASQIRSLLEIVIARWKETTEKERPTVLSAASDNSRPALPASAFKDLMALIQRLPIRTQHFDGWFCSLKKSILDNASDATRGEPMFAHFQRELLRQAKHNRDQYHQAKQALVCTGLKLVVSIAKCYANRGLTLMELIQEGNAGLMTAAEKYNPKLGYAFSTYATIWIRQSIGIAIFEKTRIVRLPMALSKKLMNADQELKRLSHTQGCKPTVEDQSSVISRNRDVYNWFSNFQNGFVSLDNVRFESGSRLVDLVDQSVPPLITMHRRHVTDEIRRAVNTLDEKKRKIVELRFGFDGDPCTLQSVGRQLGMSHTRVGQLVAESLELLKVQLHQLAND